MRLRGDPPQKTSKNGKFVTFSSKMRQNGAPQYEITWRVPQQKLPKTRNLSLFRAKCVKMATVSSQMRQNGHLFAQNASKWALFRPKCVNMGTFSPKMHQNGDSFAPNASKWRDFRPTSMFLLPPGGPESRFLA